MACLRLLFALAGLCLGACSGVPGTRPVPVSPMPQTFMESDQRWARVEPAEAQPRGEWWKAFADPILDDLVQRAVRGNTSIQVAAARWAQARAIAGTVEAQRRPQVTLNAGMSRQGGPLINAAGSDGTLASSSVTVSYELDLAGRLSANSEAAVLDAQSHEALLQSTRLLVQADVAQTYLALRALDEERAILRGTLQSYRDALRLTEHRFQSGLVAELDVSRAQLEVAATEAESLALDRRRAVMQHALAVLVGEPAMRFHLNEVAWAPAMPLIPPGIPSTVLARRPDVAAAQRSMLAAQARLHVAKVAWFPNLTLTASGGQASASLGELFVAAARAWGVGALIAAPLLDGGRRRAGVRSADAELDRSFALYRERILVAFQEVEDQLVSLRLLSAQAESQSRAHASASRSASLADSRYRNGLASQLDLLDATRSELRSRRQQVEIRAARLTATVALIRALGGGWDGLSDGRAQGGGESSPVTARASNPSRIVATSPGS